MNNSDLIDIVVLYVRNGKAHVELRFACGHVRYQWVPLSQRTPLHSLRCEECNGS